MNGGTIERTKEWENKRTTELMNGGTIERTKERENERTTELMNGGTIERTNDRKNTNERQDARTNGLTKARTN